MALTGAFAGLSFHVLHLVLEREWLAERPAMALAAFAVVFFTALLGMAGPLPLRRAALSAAGLALVVSGLLALASLRFHTAGAVFGSAIPVLAMLVLGFVPLPFLVAAQQSHWRDYPLLFLEAWTIVVRYAAAWLFVGVVWAVIFLSDLLLSMVGVTVIGALVGNPLVAMVITGAMLGLGIAVVDEMADVVSPYLVLRLLRLLLPAVLLVLLVFLAVLPFEGLGKLFGSLSAAATLLTIAAMGATLVTSAIDQSDAEASRSPVIRRAAQAMALLLPAPAVLAAWAVWLRVDQYGWTPDRVFAATVAGLGLGYGALYALAVLRGRGWEARVRQGNITMALALLLVSALLLTPLLDPQRLSAQSQLARLEDGRLSPDALDLAGLADWGRAGEAALAELEARAAQPGQEALAARLAARAATPLPATGDAETLRRDLAAVMPLRPETATVARDAILASLDAGELADWLTMCRTPLPEGGAGCVLLAGEFWPDTAGEEVILLLRDAGGYLRSEGFGWQQGLITRRSVTPLSGQMPDPAEAEAMLRAAQAGTAPPMKPAALNALHLGGAELILLP